jgi:VIT1/CCC1 family predicted Fe2+/Mn2+ transporter
MVKKEKKFSNIVKYASSYISQIALAKIFSKIVESAEVVVENIDEKIVQLEKRIIRTICSILLIGFGGIVLILALFFFLKEFLMWSNTAASFSIGIVIFVIGLLLKLTEYERRGNG